METKVEDQMARQNLKNTRKSQEDKVDKKTNFKKVTDKHVVTELNQKVRVLTDVSTIDGTLHKGETVTVEAITSTGYNVGRFWFVNQNNITTQL
jgi:uncharacterized protein YgiM (DUF1202 family)